MTWRFGAATGCCVNVPVLHVVDGFHEAGITAIEVGTPPRHFDPCRHEQVAELGGRLRALGIEPISIHAPFGGLLDLSDPNPHHRHAAIGSILTAAAALREIGGTRVVVHPTDAARDGQDVGERLAHSADSLRVLARACNLMATTLLVETPLPHLVGGHPDEFAWILGQLDRSVGVCFDTGHATLGHHWDRFIELVGDRLEHVHANDNHGRFDDHLPPGEGSIDWRRIRETLEGVGFDGWIVLELSCPAGPLSAYVGDAMRQARSLLGPP
jgi:sugar phosphate isomerase/epimerase